MSKDDFDTLDNAPTIPGEPGGQILSGRYKIIRQIGSGGMGAVYLAKDLELDIEIAIKVLPTLLANNKRAIDNLCREARTDLALSHHNIVRLHNFQSDEAIKYLVMEYINGGSLEDKITADGVLSVDETLKIFTQVAAALDYAHSQHVLHRDIKPANIMLTKDGVAKIADFGIARQLKESMTHITGKETSGTLLYMAPEQFRGGKPDHHSDIYSLAASIYECLSGKPPFWRGSIEYQIMNVPPQPLDKLSQKQNTALLKALSKEPNDRQESAKELLAGLGADSAILNWQPVKKDTPKHYKDTLDYAQTINIKVERQKAQKKKIGALVAAVLAIAVIISLMIFVKYRSQNAQQTAADITQRPVSEKSAIEPQSPIKPITIPNVQKQVEKTAQEIAKEAEAEKQKKLVEEKEKKLEQDKIEADRKKQEYDKWIAQAQASEKKGNLSDAVKFYQKALEIKPEDSEIKDELATCQHNLYLAKAEGAEKANNLDLVIENYTKALSFKQVTSTQLKLDSVKKTVQYNIEAERKKIVEKENQKEFDELLSYAKARDNKEQSKEALKALGKALELYPDNSEALTLKKKIDGYYSPNTGNLTEPPQPQQITDSSAAVVTVNGTKITEGQIEKMLQARMEQLTSRIPLNMQDQYRQQLRKRIVEQLVIEELLAQKERQENITVSQSDIDEQTNKQIAEQNLTIDEFKSLLKSYGTTLSEFESNMRKKLMFEKLIEGEFANKIKAPTNEQIKAYYDANSQQFQEPEKMHTKHILIIPEKNNNRPERAKAQAKMKAQEILGKIKAGGNFEELAKQYSQCPSAKNGGDLGMQPKGTFVSEFEKAAYSLKPGQVSDVVETNFGFHIIKLVEYANANTCSLDKAKGQIVEVLTNKQKEQIVLDYIQKIKAEADIKFANESDKIEFNTIK
ncbi:MAG: protein kinase [Phycisphaerae bacterium]|jgi:serine/threonine-protein kinase